jgi:ATP-dependent Lon protease
LEITGQLGDVMKESCQIAYTFARGFLDKVDESNLNSLKITKNSENILVDAA